MNNEIKEILDIERYRNKDGFVQNINLLPDEIHKVLDYITNLQKEKETRQYDINNLTYQLAKEKSKINKAIEYIKYWHYRNDYRVNSFTRECKNDLLNILQGEDKE